MQEDKEQLKRPIDPFSLAFEPDVAPWRKELSARIIGGVLSFSSLAGRRWLWVANISSLFFLVAAFGVPLAQAGGMDWLARPFFDFCHLVCVQDPSHSFYIEGHQMAVCERCLAIYAALGLAGLLFHLVRYRLRPIKFWQYGLLAFPLAVDGFTQLFGWRQSTWELRLATGFLFGLGTVWYMFPQVEAKMQRLAIRAERELNRTGI